MITYWSWSGQWSLLAWFWGLPLVAGIGGILVAGAYPHLEVGEAFALLLALDIIPGLVCLALVGGKVHAGIAFVISAAVFAGIGAIIFKPQLGAAMSGPISDWGKPEVFGRWRVDDLRDGDYYLVLHKGEVFTAYGVSDVAEVKKRVANDKSSDGIEPVSFLTPLMSPLTDLQVSVVDNQFRVSGFDSDLDGLFVIIEGYVSVGHPSRPDAKEPTRRLFGNELYELSSADKKRGYVTMPLARGQQMRTHSAKRLIKWDDSMQVHMQYVEDAIEY